MLLFVRGFLTAAELLLSSCFVLFYTKVKLAAMISSVTSAQFTLPHDLNYNT